MLKNMFDSLSSIDPKLLMEIYKSETKPAFKGVR